MSNESINNCVRNIVNQANELTKKELNGRSEPKVESKCAASKMQESNKPVESNKSTESNRSTESNKTVESVKPSSDHKASTNKSDQHESITIIQTKPAPNSRTAIKFDANNNLPPQSDLKQHATESSAPSKKSTDETDKPASVKAKQLNGDDLPAEKVKQEELPEIELIIRVSFSFPDKSSVCV